MNLGVAMEENRAKALELVHRALASDPEMPKVQALLGYLKIMYTGNLADVKEAANHLRRALVSDPSEPDALWALSVVHMYAGRASAAYPLAEKLRQVEPLGTYALWILPAVHLFDGRYDLALAEFRRLYDLDPMNPGWGPWLALALAYEGKIDEAAALIDERARLTPEDNHTKLSLMQICGLKGDTQIVSNLLAGPFREWCWSERVWASRVATAYALLNEREEALRWLEHAIDIGFINYPWLAERDRWLENLRGEEDFKELMMRVKKEWEEFEV
jgi:tetratricopeptide (TPR) repeat protein